MGLGGEGLGCQRSNSLEWVGPGEVGGLGGEARTGQGRRHLYLPRVGTLQGLVLKEMVVRERSSRGWAGRGCAETKGTAINTLPGLGLVTAVGRRGWGAGRR